MTDTPLELVELDFQAPSPAKRLLLNVVGTIALGVGMIAVFIPVVPTTPLLLVAAACYAHSSERMYNWLINNRLTGKHVRDMKLGRGISLRLKLGTLVLAWVMLGSVILFTVESMWLKGVLLGVLLLKTVVMARIKTAPAN